MAKTNIVACPTCGYPLAEGKPGQVRVCEYCQAPLIARVAAPVSLTAAVPPGVLWGAAGLILGVIIGRASRLRR